LTRAQLLFNQVALCNIVFLLNYSFLKLQIMLEAIRTYALRTPSCHPVLLLTITNFTLHYIAPINPHLILFLRILDPELPIAALVFSITIS
jgi:hypothetical protein